MYVLERLQGIEKIARTKVKNKFTTPATVLSWDEKRKLIDKSGVKLKTFVKSYNIIADAFDFSGYETEEKTDKQKLCAAIKRLDISFQTAKDNLMLGDANEAIELIAKLEKEWLT